MSNEQPMVSSRVGNSRFVAQDPIISFATGPPPNVWQGHPLTVAVNVAFPGSEGMHRDNFALNISLIDDQGHKHQRGLRGSLTLSLKPFVDGGRQQVAVFKDITIHEIGRHRLRILLAAASLSQATIKARHDSDFVEVQPYGSVFAAGINPSYPPLLRHSTTNDSIFQTTARIASWGSAKIEGPSGSQL